MAPAAGKHTMKHGRQHSESEIQDVQIKFSSDVKRQLAELYRATTDYEPKGPGDHEFDRRAHAILGGLAQLPEVGIRTSDDCYGGGKICCSNKEKRRARRHEASTGESGP
jgi:hypothetical protein